VDYDSVCPGGVVWLADGVCPAYVCHIIGHWFLNLRLNIVDTERVYIACSVFFVIGFSDILLKISTL
jgi:hypothetical protein